MINPFSIMMMAISSPSIESSAHGGDGSLESLFADVHTNRSGVRVNEKTANTVAAYHAAIRNVSEDVGKLPLKIYRNLPGGGKELAPDHPVYPLFKTRPNPYMTSMGFRQTLQKWKMGWGNGHAEIQLNALGEPAALWPIHPSRVKMKRKGMSEPVYQVRNDNNTFVEIPWKRMFHLRGPGDGYTGEAILTHANESLGMLIASQQFAASFFGNGTMVSGIIEVPGKISPEAEQRMRESWNTMHQGAHKAHRIAIMEQGVKFNPTSMPLRHAQFLESRHFGIEEVARWFRMPPHKLQHLLRSTFSNIEHQDLEYAKETILPHLITWEQEIALKFFNDPSPVDDDLFAEHNINALLRADSDSRAKFYNQQFQIGALNINEIRELENMNPIGPEGNVYYVMANLTPVGERTDPPPRPPANPPRQLAENSTALLDMRTVADDIPVASLFDKNIGLESCAEMLKDPIGRMVRKEVKALGRLARKPKAEFNAQLTEYYSTHKDQLVETILPVAQHLAQHGGFDNDAFAAVNAVADEVCTQAKIAARDAFKEGLMSELCESWSANRTNEIANKIRNATLKN